MLPRVEAELLRHPIVLDNRYTRWFRKGEATQEYLRRFTRKLIQAVCGIGYMIEAPDKSAEKPETQAEERQV